MYLTKIIVMVIASLLFIEAITSLLSAQDDLGNIIGLLLIPLFVFTITKINKIKKITLIKNKNTNEKN
jgi:cell division protein FtsW (lipid II flippase)